MRLQVLVFISCLQLYPVCTCVFYTMYVIVIVIVYRDKALHGTSTNTRYSAQ